LDGETAFFQYRHSGFSGRPFERTDGHFALTGGLERIARWKAPAAAHCAMA
jgi:hypothetical protein